MSINKEGLTFEEWLLATGIATDQHHKAWEAGEDPSEWKLANHGAVTVKLADNLKDTQKKVKVPARMYDVGELKNNWYTRAVADTNLRVVMNEFGHCMGWLDD